MNIVNVMDAGMDRDLDTDTNMATEMDMHMRMCKQKHTYTHTFTSAHKCKALKIVAMIAQQSKYQSRQHE